VSGRVILFQCFEGIYCLHFQGSRIFFWESLIFEDEAVYSPLKHEESVLSLFAIYESKTG